ncbi:peroxiredoxin [Deinococcus sp. QL22]|uniref:peroxiredoxin family protein n=1 Tax=Deinococcus sp. QL22 TaxID=2939437 RepID=UPI0020181DF2|nr:redoxin domain-containing protein [Deinococcus sp. QL22]UQN08842.1 redoxin domain-containing protein [Deinococcus sp. QL22]
MLIVPALQAVTQAAEQNEPTVLQLAFPDPGLTTSVQLYGGQVMGIRSPLLPAWSVSLTQHGVHPATVAEVQQQTKSLFGALSLLIERGYLTSADVTAIYRQRVVSALLPLAWRNGTVQTKTFPGASPPPTLHSFSAAEGVQAAQLHAEQLGTAERALRPSDRFDASPLGTLPSGLGEPAHRVYTAALRGLTLGEMSERLGQRWDVLTRNVVHLQGLGVLRPAGTAVSRKAAPQLMAGQLAPDFCLPALGGGETRLSDLRGKPVWLTFNRQSTCAMCNPHHAQIMSLHGPLAARGVQMVSIWGSTLPDLSSGIGALGLPYPVLADPHDETYDRYGLSMSLTGTLDLRNLPTMMQGFKMMGVGALKSDGELLRMPAEFLIGADGRIEVAHYNSYGTDWLPVEQVLKWSAVRDD